MHRRTAGGIFRNEKWFVVVPLKPLALAKSRLTGIEPEHRAALALAFAADMVTAALRTPHVVGVVVVTDDLRAAAVLRALGATVIGDEPAAGLNRALLHGVDHAARRQPGCGIVLLPADLPALRPKHLERAIRRAAHHSTAVVPDAETRGTVAYFARGDATPSPQFGPSSFQAHLRTGATALARRGLGSLQRDVDTPDHLEAALHVGVGSHTSVALSRFSAAG